MKEGDIVRHKLSGERLSHWHRWTKAEHRLLVRTYRKHGDTAIAEMLNRQFPKGYPWTNKHVEKRRKYFGLKRTKAEEHRIRVLNNGDGRQYKTWDTRGRAKDGEIRRWGRALVIKSKGKWHSYFRYVTKAKKGQIVRTHDGGITITDRRGNQLMNARLRAALPPELKQTVKALNQLKKIINGKEDSRPKRNVVRHH